MLIPLLSWTVSMKYGKNSVNNLITTVMKSEYTDLTEFELAEISGGGVQSPYWNFLGKVAASVANYMESASGPTHVMARRAI